MNIVGTPYSDVQRSAWTVSSTLSGSKHSAGTTMHAPVLQQGEVVGLAEALGHQEQFHARLIERVFEFRRLVGRVDVDEDRADAGRGVLHDDPLVAVRRPDADALALGDAEVEQRAGELPC